MTEVAATLKFPSGTIAITKPWTILQAFSDRELSTDNYQSDLDDTHAVFKGHIYSIYHIYAPKTFFNGVESNGLEIRSELCSSPQAKDIVLANAMERPTNSCMQNVISHSHTAQHVESKPMIKPVQTLATLAIDSAR